MGNSKSRLRKERRRPSHNEQVTQNEETDRSQDLFMPESIKEIERTQYKYFLYKHIFECRFSPPIEDKLNEGTLVLDIGCGPGTWILDMASHYPCSEFYGFDIHEIYPTQIRPPNAHFKQANALDGLAFEKDTFELVRLASMAISFDELQYLEVIRDSLRILKPGGYIEIIETEDSFINEGPILRKFIESFKLLLARHDMDVKLSQKLDSLVSLSGFVNIQTDRRIIILNESEGGISGKLFMQLVDDFFQCSVTETFAADLGLSIEEYKEHWQVCKDEIVTYKTGLVLKKIWAQKNLI
ncbi:3929_t:CDS:2 [Ambispora leptoticha]|uniref:3929_t:CDS:1 n=1 Tax=Ambispora leptoticha TaxID=144679 RepID=A0A9N9C697_9GLOM|nr:3929_t:CDS:2 [Ambispora leptoticha]